MKKCSVLVVLLSSLFLTSVSAEIAGYNLTPQKYKPSEEQHLFIKGLKSNTEPKILFKLDWESGNTDSADKCDKNIGYTAYFSLWIGLDNGKHHYYRRTRILSQLTGTYNRNLETKTFISQFAIKSSEDLGNGTTISDLLQLKWKEGDFRNDLSKFGLLANWNPNGFDHNIPNKKIDLNRNDKGERMSRCGITNPDEKVIFQLEWGFEDNDTLKN